MIFLHVFVDNFLASQGLITHEMALGVRIPSDSLIVFNYSHHEPAAPRNMHQRFRLVYTSLIATVLIVVHPNDHYTAVLF
ncbi:hypothetical protein Y032_0223g2671 [Ancylostoma ceylanicum]|uniref:Uncharacterized protein n=1 Tax=Ancylostoma ceylanicum TaxID=53326 RepID=A0A016SHQ9_9BILA|nr:hypothetical protein Y032_0223g2671 [Ancylostoma ceylanicum]